MKPQNQLVRSVKTFFAVLHDIYSGFVLSDHLWFSSFFPFEFATPAAVAVLRPEPLHLHRLRQVRKVSLCNFCSCHR